MASVGFGSRLAAAAVAPASSSSTAGRRRPSRVGMVVVVRATRGQPAPAEEEKSFADFIFGAIFKKDQLVETDPLLNKVDGAAAPSSAIRRPPVGGKKPAASSDEDGGGGGFNLGGLFAKKG